MQQPPLISLWQRLRRRWRERFRPEPTAERRFQFEESLALSLRDLARREQRTEDEIVSDLLKFAITHRTNTEIYMQYWESLTLREQQVAALVCLGYTNAEIGQKLFISPETVKTHVKNITHKFGLRRKVDLRQVLAGWDFSEWDPPSRR